MLSIEDQLVQRQFGLKKIGFEQNWKGIICIERANQISMMSKIEVVFVNLISCATYTEASQGIQRLEAVVQRENKTQKIARKVVIQFPHQRPIHTILTTPIGSWTSPEGLPTICKLSPAWNCKIQVSRLASKFKFGFIDSLIHYIY